MFATLAGPVLAGAALAFVLVDRAGGRGLAVLAVAGVFVAPLLLGMLAEGVASRRGREVRAERLYRWLAPVLALGFVLAATLGFRRAVGRALAGIPARYEWTRGWIGAPLRALGVRLSPDAAQEPTTPPRAAEREDAPGLEVSVTIASSTRRTVSSSGAPPEIASGEPSTRPAGSGSTAPAEGERPAYASGDLSYRESTECRGMPELAAIREAHAPGGTRASAEALAAARYPDGLPFLQAQSDEMLSTWFKGAPDTFAGVGSRFDAAVHEGSHVWGAKTFRGATRSYSVRADLTIETRLLKNFDRHEILARHVDAAGDTYAKTYLEGTSGAQGFNSLLDEYVAYAHTLAARWCTRDLVASGQRVSARDGILTFMYYVELYLELARTAHAADYAAIVGDAGHRRLIVTVWDRAELFLRASASDRALGIADAKIERWVYDPARLAEIRRLRDAPK